MYLRFADHFFDSKVSAEIAAKQNEEIDPKIILLLS
jgi:hypothetical protein